MEDQEIKLETPSVEGLTQEQDLTDLMMRFFATYKLKKSVADAPTYTPKNFYDSIVFYDGDLGQRLYIYLNKTNTWKYATLA